MRTNIDLNDELMEEARQFSSARTKRGIIEEALRLFVELKSVERKRKDYARRSEEIRQMTRNIKLGKSSADIIREERNRR
jgi:Arc/MetJ family transcription regulator